MSFLKRVGAKVDYGMQRRVYQRQNVDELKWQLIDVWHGLE